LSPDSRTLLLDDMHLYNVPQTLRGDRPRLRLWVEVITGRELDAGGEVADLEATAWQQRRDRLHKLGGPP